MHERLRYKHRNVATEKEYGFHSLVRDAIRMSSVVAVLAAETVGAMMYNGLRRMHASR